MDYMDGDPEMETQLPTPEGWKAELALLAGPQRTLYPQSDQLSTADRERGRESPPVARRRHLRSDSTFPAFL